MKKNIIKIKITTFEEPERIFNGLEHWLSENVQEYELEVEGNDKLKYKQTKDD